MVANVTVSQRGPAERAAPERARRDRSTNVGRRERLVSAIGGGVLAAWGLSHRGITGLAAAALGGGLLARGASGRCAVYRAFGISTGGPGTWRRRVEDSVTIARSCEEVFRHLRAPERAETLFTGMGRMRVAEEQEPDRIVWRSYDIGDGERTVTARLTPAPGGRGTEVHITLEHTPAAKGAGRGMARLLGEGPERRIHRALRQVKQRIEAGEVPVIEGQPSGRLIMQRA